MLLHAFYTWLVANLLYPLFLFCFTIITDGQSGFLFNTELIWVFVAMLMVSIPCSVPCLLAGWACLGLISHARLTVRARFWIWFTAAQLTVAGFILLLALYKGLQPETLLLTIPGALAVCLAVLIRYRQFRKLFCSFPYAHYVPDAI
jgi:hypothetical protein